MGQDTTRMDDEHGSASSETIFRLSYWFGEVDTRWFGVFRILLGLLILKDAIYHLPLATIFYSDEGVIPRWALFDGLVRDPRFSLMDALGRPWMVVVFFCLWIVILIFLIIGYRVRLMTVLNFIIILSVHERNGYILTSADSLMRAMSFWMMFAPVGQYYSIDAIRRCGQGSRRAFALPVRMIQLQFVIVYISTAYLKAISPIWQAGEALHYVVQVDTFILPIGVWMRSWSPELLQFASYFAYYAEVAIPILLLMPVFWRGSRLLAFILALLLHGGIAVALSIPDFSILMLICYVPFFAPEWLEWLEHRYQDKSVVASRTIASRSRMSQRVLLSVVLLPLFALLVLWNIEKTGEYNRDGFHYPRPVEAIWASGRDIIWYTGLWQYWDMFSPTPIQYDGWLVVEGQFENGFRYDLFTGEPIDYERPTRWYWGPWMRWEKYEENIYRWRYDALLQGWGAYYCRTINEGRIESIRLATIRIVMNKKNFYVPGEIPDIHQQEELWFHWCFDDYAPSS